MVWSLPYIISDKGNDLIPGAKAHSDPSAAIRKASTFSLEICAEYLSIEVETIMRDASAPVAGGNTISTIKKDK